MQCPHSLRRHVRGSGILTLPLRQHALNHQHLRCYASSESPSTDAVPAKGPASNRLRKAASASSEPTLRRGVHRHSNVPEAPPKGDGGNQGLHYPALRARKGPMEVGAKKHVRKTGLNEAIVYDDLDATLEAHRNANRASVIRKLNMRAEDDVWRPDFIAARRPVKKKSQDHTEKDRTPPMMEGAKVSQTTGLPAQENDSKEAQQWRSKHEQGRAMAENRLRLLQAFGHSDEPEIPIEDAMGTLAQLSRTRGVLNQYKAERDNLRKQGLLQANPDLKGLGHIMEYEAFPVPPQLSEQVPVAGMPPWMFEHLENEPGPTTDPTKLLNWEIKAFAEWVKLQPAEVVGRNAVVNETLRFIHEALPGLDADVFGSQTTGLALPNSDIDIRIGKDLFPLAEDGKTSELAESATSLETTQADGGTTKAQEVAQRVYAAFASNPSYTSVELIEAPRNPLVNVTHVASGIEIQLNIGRHGASAEVAHSLITHYLSLYPTLRPLYLLIRTALDMRGLSNVFLGGFSSYSTLMMCAFSIAYHSSRREEWPVKPLATAEDDVAQDLLEFLHFFATLNPYTTGIALEPEPVIFRKRRFDPDDPAYASYKQRRGDLSEGTDGEQANKEDTAMAKGGRKEYDLSDILLARHIIGTKNSYMHHHLCMQDPGDPWNDLGKRNFGVKFVQASFFRMAKQLNMRLERAEQSEKDKQKQKRGPMTKVLKPGTMTGHKSRLKGKSMLRDVVGVCEKVYAEARMKLELYGEEILDQEREAGQAETEQEETEQKETEQKETEQKEVEQKETKAGQPSVPPWVADRNSS